MSSVAVKACEPAHYQTAGPSVLAQSGPVSPGSPGPLVLVVDPVELDLVQDVEVAEVGRPLALPGPDQLDRGEVVKTGITHVVREAIP